MRARSGDCKPECNRQLEAVRAAATASPNATGSWRRCAQRPEARGRACGGLGPKLPPASGSTVPAVLNFVDGRVQQLAGVIVLSLTLMRLWGGAVSSKGIPSRSVYQVLPPQLKGKLGTDFSK